MFTAFISAALLAVCASASMNDVLAGRQVNNTLEVYLNKVCFPNTTSPVPPCQEIINIQSACEANGTTPLALEAHAQCMCGGSFFSDWIGCLNCHFVHGARSPQIVSAFNSIITTVSHQLCTGTPTAPFASLFASYNPNEEQSGSMTDLYPSRTEISLYYTATGTQGAGVITGSATAATRSGSSPTTTKSSSQASGIKSSGTGVAAGTTGSTSSSKAGAAPTGVWLGGMGVVAGGLVMAAL